MPIINAESLSFPIEIQGNQKLLQKPILSLLVSNGLNPATENHLLAIIEILAKKLEHIKDYAVLVDSQNTPTKIIEALLQRNVPVILHHTPFTASNDALIADMLAKQGCIINLPQPIDETLIKPLFLTLSTTFLALATRIDDTTLMALNHAAFNSGKKMLIFDPSLLADAQDKGNMSLLKLLKERYDIRLRARVTVISRDFFKAINKEYLINLMESPQMQARCFQDAYNKALVTLQKRKHDDLNLSEANNKFKRLRLN